MTERASSSLTHPLMPGIRCRELWNPDWPRVLHDGQLTGFSPLVCGMRQAPEIWASIPIGGELSWVEPVTGVDGERGLLLEDGRLRLFDLDGKVRWTSPESGSLVFFGDLRGTGEDSLLLAAGPRLALLNGRTGRTEWTRIFDPPHAQVRAAVGKLLPCEPGLAAAVFLAYAETGCLVHFAPEGEPRIVWEREVVVPGEWPPRADHGCTIQLDLSEPREPMIWNIRHHRCRGFDAATGEMVSSLVYEIGGGLRRNYGPWSFGRGQRGELYICVVAEQIQTHVHGIRLNRRGPSSLAWEQYYGEVYVKPGVALRQIAVADLDGDGTTEVAYNVRDPEEGFRALVRVRAVDTGQVRAELADRWCVAPVPDLAGEGRTGLLVCPAPGGVVPEGGDLELYLLDPGGGLRQVGVLPAALPWGVVHSPSPSGTALLVRQTDARGMDCLSRHVLGQGGLRQLDSSCAEPLLTAPLRAVVEREQGGPLLLVPGTRGGLQAVAWPGESRWEVDLQGGALATLSAADLDCDGRAELVAATPGQRVRLFSLKDRGAAKEVANHEFHAPRYRLGPLLYDLEGNGSSCLVAPGRAAGGRLCVRTFRVDGSLLWETGLDASTADGGTVVAWNAGRFLPGPRAAVAVSVLNTGRTLEGTFLLDGPTGKVVWFRDRHWQGEAVRGFIPTGLPAAFDVDGDGVEEIGMDLYSFMAWVRGADAGFARLHHTANIQAEGALFAAHLYNSFCPVYRSPTDTEPYWFSPLGHDIFGLMNPDPVTGPWREQLDYDVPPRVGLVDVDGDGVLEVGYAPLNDPVFRCRDLWTGATKWELRLPTAPNAPVIAADVDGDGKGEFLVGRYCIGTDAAGQGQVRWESPVPLGWAVIADFDGDGQGEIACPAAGRICILKARG